jgi:UDP-GlcNAc:undecaprenyl-phosphate GlcNAc-1-phosphate transferase
MRSDTLIPPDRLLFFLSEATIRFDSTILLVLAGLASAGLLAFCFIRWLGPLGFLDVPGGRKCHEEAVARVGGVALAGTLLIGTLAGWTTGVFRGTEAVALFAVAILGMLDDRFSLKARWKAILSLLIAVFLAWHQVGEVMPHANGISLLGFPLIPDPWLIGGLLVALYWAVPQSYNLIDGANGLALGCAVIVLGTLALAGTPAPFLLGAVLALFLFNWPRARCFLGDCGSLLLGLILALLAAETFGRTRPDGILWVFAYPVADVCMVVVIRLATQQPLSRGDRNHLHYQWGAALGRSSALAVPLLWLNMALCASGALLRGDWRVIPFLGLLALLAQVLCFAFRSIRNHRSQASAPPLARERRGYREA